MHVCFVCNEYPPAPHGGTGSSYRDLAEGLVAAGHKVTVVGVYRPKFYVRSHTDEILNEVRVVRHPASYRLPYKIGALTNRYWLSRWLKREHKKTPFDIIEGSDYGGWLRFGGPAGVPTIVRIRGANFFFDEELQRSGDIFEHGLEIAALKRADFIGSVSRYAAERTLAIGGMSERKYTVIYNAVDTALFSPGSEVKTEPGTVLFVNSVIPKKGIEQLIDAMHLVWKSRPEAKLIALGKTRHKTESGANYVDALMERVDPVFRDRVVFTGSVDRYTSLIDYLRRAHVCCYPSHMETFGIAAIEAMSVGKPTIFSRTGPGPEVLEDGVSGFLCDPYSPPDIADKILKIICDNNVAETLARNARQRVQDMFNKSSWVERNVEFYTRCTAEQR